MNVWTADNAYRFGHDDGYQAGYLAGRTAAWAEAFRVTTEQLGHPDPATPYPAGQSSTPTTDPHTPRSGVSRSDGPAPAKVPHDAPAHTPRSGVSQTAAQIRLGARWSWSQVERRIAGQAAKPASNVTDTSREHDARTRTPTGLIRAPAAGSR